MRPLLSSIWEEIRKEKKPWRARNKLLLTASTQRNDEHVVLLRFNLTCTQCQLGFLFWIKVWLLLAFASS
uniref:Uncharacterized protein n=1 Tax=Lotus japonicus TaxID=34305 RepID=I3T945_LOTJA|nr:unknown [Lotus japonicus]